MYATLASVLVTSPPTQPHARKALRKSLRKSFFQRERVLVHEHQPWRSHDGSEEFFHREKLYRSISEKCVRGISLTGAASPIYINIGRVEASGEQLFSPKTQWPRKNANATSLHHYPRGPMPWEGERQSAIESSSSCYSFSSLFSDICFPEFFAERGNMFVSFFHWRHQRFLFADKYETVNSPLSMLLYSFQYFMFISQFDRMGMANGGCEWWRPSKRNKSMEKSSTDMK